MSDSPVTPLPGGFMSGAALRDGVVVKPLTPASATLQRFARHLRDQGIYWVPEPLGLTETEERWQRLPFEPLEGALPSWIWEESLLSDVAGRLRSFHDASLSFNREGAVWNCPPLEPDEVIIHRDFAPYNCLFEEEGFRGLVDFDLCGPGPRLWDMAYVAYRFVPLMPPFEVVPGESWAVSPFEPDRTLHRLSIFLAAYGSWRPTGPAEAEEALDAARHRLASLADWILEWQSRHPDTPLVKNVAIYRAHAEWLGQLLPRSAQE